MKTIKRKSIFEYTRHTERCDDPKKSKSFQFVSPLQKEKTQLQNIKQNTFIMPEPRNNQHFQPSAPGYGGTDHHHQQPQKVIIVEREPRQYGRGEQQSDAAAQGCCAALAATICCCCCLPVPE